MLAPWRACSVSSIVEARAWLDAEDVPAEARRIDWHASLRHQHQGFEAFGPGRAAT